MLLIFTVSSSSNTLVSVLSFNKVNAVLRNAIESVLSSLEVSSSPSISELSSETSVLSIEATSLLLGSLFVSNFGCATC